MSLSEAFNIGPCVRPADCAAKHDTDEIKQVMVSPTVFPRVCHIDKVCRKFKVSELVHREDSVQSAETAANQRHHLTGSSFTQNSIRNHNFDVRLPC